MTGTPTAMPDGELAGILRVLVEGEAGCGCDQNPVALMREDAPIYLGRSTS